jgi:hypothetical protein
MDAAANRSPAPPAAELARVEVARGELLDPGSLATLAAELGCSQP